MKKNIHLIPTDKPSRLAFLHDDNLHIGTNFKKGLNVNTVNVYITSDGEIKEGYYLDLTHNIVMKSVFYPSSDKNCKKIILTTDQDLIKNGVQAIDDDFLEWFVKNPSCEFVDVNDWMDINGNIAFGGNIRYQISCSTYKEIILPQEEPKQDYSGVHFRHCYQGEYEDGCKYGKDDCPAKPKEEPKQEFTMKESIEEAAREFDKSKCKHFRREHTKEEVYDSFEEGFTAGAKSDAAREMWHKKFKHESINALKAIENLCDSQNPTHEDIWRIAYGVINDLTGKE
jgi:hypothetical protein